MFRITEEDYDEMVAVISKCCCSHPDPCQYCSTIDCCDVQTIYKILRSHLEKNYIKPDEEKTVIEWSKKEPNVICHEDKLPFKE